MTRHFLALLALLTGLAAFGGPAQASLAEAMACNTSIAAAAGEEISGSESAAAQAAPASLRATRALEVPELRPATPDALRLPVLMGIDRAYE
jgi:parvulin-like peptidyl-prolyl isomerase